MLLQKTALLAVVDDAVRGSLGATFANHGWEIRTVRPGRELLREWRPDWLVVLETGDDAALLTQLVYELYGRSQGADTPIIIGIASRSVLERNPALGCWCIRGQAALLALPVRDSGDWERDIARLAERAHSSMNSAGS